MGTIFKAVTLFTIILLLWAGNMEAIRIVKFTNGSSRYSPKYFSNFTLFTKNDGIYIDMTMIQQIKTGFKFNVELQIRLGTSKDYQTLSGYTLDVCNLIISSKGAMFNKWFKSLLKYGNFMQNCPMPEGHYYLNGWKLESSLVPSYLYPGDYRLKCYGFTGRYKTKTETFAMELNISTLIQDV